MLFANVFVHSAVLSKAERFGLTFLWDLVLIFNPMIQFWAKRNLCPLRRSVGAKLLSLSSLLSAFRDSYPVYLRLWNLYEEFVKIGTDFQFL
jgi:hypothetical protein